MISQINEEPRREAIAHIKSLEFDPSRKILVVEGKTDRLFLEHLTSGEIAINTTILEISSVEFHEQISGGNRGKIIYFASLTNKEEERLKFLVDKDYSKYTNDIIPNNVILTDYKDLESYLFEEKYLDKFLKIGLKTEKIKAKKILEELNKAKYFGFVRITSLEKEMNLSINKTNDKLSKYLEFDNTFNLTIKQEKYLDSLIQNSTYSVEKTILKKNVDEIIDKYSIEENRNIVHGKDAISIIEEICVKLGYKSENIGSVFWMSFDGTKVSKYPNLKKAVDFIKN